MAEPFDIAIEFVLSEEGGYVNHPADPGGATSRGISLRAVVGLKDASGQLEWDLDGDGDVDAADIKQIEELYQSGAREKIVEFYRERYWKTAGCDQLYGPLAMVVFDMSVHSGPRAAIVCLQKAIRVGPDGVFGRNTERAARVLNPAKTVIEFLTKRGRLLYDLSVKNGGVFYDGWLARLFRLQSEAFARRIR